MTETLNETQTAALRELARGPMRYYAKDRMGRSLDKRMFRHATIMSLVRGGYAEKFDIRVRLTPAGLDAARLRGFLPQLANVVKGDSLSSGEGQP